MATAFTLNTQLRPINFLQFCAAQNCRGHPFFRSYGARLPSSLTRFHSRALAHLCPPTCVGLRYGQPWEHLIDFLDTSFSRSASAEASTSPCGTVTFNRRPASTHVSN